MRPAYLMDSLVVGAVTIALAGCGSATGPTVSILKNDGYTSGVPTFLGAFLTGEAAAVVLGPVDKGSTIRSVEFFFGGSDTAKTVTLTIYADAGTDNPGSVLYSHDYQMTPYDVALQRIDLTAQHIVVDAGQKIRVAVFFQHDGFPGVAKDADGNTATRNYVYSSGSWYKLESLGGDWDYIIRAEIEN
jgi:hypothetical protein